MDAVTYIRERARMCERYGCEDCPLKKYPDCYNPEDASGAVATVEQWSKEHPMVTNGKKMLELIGGEESQWEGGGTVNGMVQIRVSKKWWDAEYKGE